MNKPSVVNKLLVDGDIVAYRAAWSVGDGYQWEMEDKVDELMEGIIRDTLLFSSGSDYKTYLTGKGNFRYDVAKTAAYKGNRVASVKPPLLSNARQHLQKLWNGIIVDGQEADDAIGIEVTLSDPETTVVASIDKDMLQLNCWHYNFTKNTFVYSTKEDGIKFFYKQILTGDVADNIKGIFRVGPVKAEKILDGLATEEEFYKAVVEAYDGDKERVLENARLLWLRRVEGEMWGPPSE